MIHGEVVSSLYLSGPSFIMYFGRVICMENIVDHFSFHLNHICIDFSTFSLFGVLSPQSQCASAVSDTFSFHRFCFKFNDRIPLSVLLLLSIIVELHPSFSVEHPCNVCTLEVEDSGKVLCIFVSQWVHIACSTDIEESTYSMMIWQKIQPQLYDIVPNAAILNLQLMCLIHLH